MVWGHLLPPSHYQFSDFLDFKKDASTFSIAFLNFELIPNCESLSHICGKLSTEDNLRTNIKLRDINFKLMTIHHS